MSEWADMKAEEIMNEVSETEDHATASIGDESDIPPSTSTTPRRKPKPEAHESSLRRLTGQTHDTGTVTGNSTLDQVLQLHTSRRMKKGGKSQGVSIPSQRRWLRYWSETLHGTSPKQVQVLQTVAAHPPKARLYGINVRMKESGVGTTVTVIRVANMLLDRASRRDPTEDDRGAGDVWVSLARYEDKMVHELERRVRENVDFEYESDGVTSKNSMFATPKWDDKKMVQSFARLGMAQGNHTQVENEAEDSLMSYSLVPIPSSEWINIGGETESSAVEMNDGIVLDSSREVRVKLYMGQVSDDTPLWLLIDRPGVTLRYLWDGYGSYRVFTCLNLQTARRQFSNLCATKSTFRSVLEQRSSMLNLIWVGILRQLRMRRLESWK